MKALHFHSKQTTENDLTSKRCSPVNYLLSQHIYQVSEYFRLQMLLSLRWGYVSINHQKLKISRSKMHLIHPTYQTSSHSLTYLKWPQNTYLHQPTGKIILMPLAASWETIVSHTACPGKDKNSKYSFHWTCITFKRL